MVFLLHNYYFCMNLARSSDKKGGSIVSENVLGVCFDMLNLATSAGWTQQF